VPPCDHLRAGSRGRSAILSPRGEGSQAAFGLGAPGYSDDRNVKLVLEKKEDIKMRLKRSPDDGDARTARSFRKGGAYRAAARDRGERPHYPP